jgi:hypothetical protein
MRRIDMVDQLNRRVHTRVRDRRAFALAALTIGLAPALASSAQAASPVPLATADSFALLGGSTITNTGATTITGDIGLCCTGVATPGFGPGANQVNQPGGAQYIGTGSVAATAQDDLDIAYGNAAGQAVTNTVPVDLSLTGTPATPLLPGVYESTAHGAFQINTSLTLDFQGDPNAVFIFQGTELTTAAGAPGSINIVNGGATPSTCNIFWQLSDATQGVTLGAGSAFKGTTMALGASVLGTGATVEGRILTRRSKAVTLDTNTITRTACAAPSGGGGVTTPTGTVTPTPGAAAPSATAPSATAPISSTPSPAGGSPQPGASPPGTAQISGPSGPVGGPFTVSVTGNAIQSVTFYVDGVRHATVKARPGRTKFKLKINPRRQNRGVHRVTARVTFTPASRTPVTTRRVTYRRPPLAPRPPQFTG